MSCMNYISRMAQGILGAFELQAHDRLVRDTGHVFTAFEIGQLDASMNRRFGR